MPGVQMRALILHYVHSKGEHKIKNILTYFNSIQFADPHCDHKCHFSHCCHRCCFSYHGSLTRCAKWRVVHAPGMSGTFSRHRLQRKPLVSDPGMNHDPRVTHVSWCMSESLTRGGRETFVPGITGACATHNFAYLIRVPLEHNFSRHCRTWVRESNKFAHDRCRFSATGQNNWFVAKCVHNIISWSQGYNWRCKERINVVADAISSWCIIHFRCDPRCFKWNPYGDGSYNEYNFFYCLAATVYT